MEENSRRMRAYAYIENILKKHINIKDKHTDTSWDLMIIRDSLRACDYFDKRREELIEEGPKKDYCSDFDDFDNERMIDHLENEISVEEYYDQCDYKVNYKLINYNKNLIRLLKEKEDKEDE